MANRAGVLVPLLTVLAACSGSPGPLGDCPSGSPVSHCVTRSEAWKAMAAQPVDGGVPDGCPSTEELGAEGLSKLGLSGSTVDEEVTWDQGTDRCCYTTRDRSC